MTQVEHRVGVHESTVKHADELASSYATPRKRVRGSGRSSRVETLVKVHPEVMNAARKLAGGDMSRLRIVDEFTVMVR